MNDKLKDKALVVIFILMIGSCLMALSSNQISGRMRQDLDRERYLRIVAEENLNKAGSKISSLEAESSAFKDKIQGIQAVLEEGQEKNSDLRTQLESISKTKSALERKIEALQKRIAEAQEPVEMPVQ